MKNFKDSHEGLIFSLNDLIREEVENVFSDNQQVVEAEISTSLSFLQDIQSSVKKIESQKELISTNSEVDKYLQEAIDNLDKAVELYFKKIPIEVKKKVSSRFKEVKI